MDSRKYNEKDVTASLDGIAEAIKSGGLAPSVIADPYSDEATYSVGDYVTFNAKSYRCITTIDTPEEFNSEKWDEIKVLDELASAVELPPVTSTDNGKILTVAEGVWSKGDIPTELPEVSGTDNGKILKVTEGVWAKGDAPSGGSVFVVNMTFDQGFSSPGQMDVTGQQLLDAISSNKTIIANVSKVDQNEEYRYNNIPFTGMSIDIMQPGKAWGVIYNYCANFTLTCISRPNQQGENTNITRIFTVDWLNGTTMPAIQSINPESFKISMKMIQGTT